MSTLRVAQNALTGAAAVRAGTGGSVPDEMRSWYTLVHEGMSAEHRIENRYFRGRQVAAPTFSATVHHAAPGQSHLNEGL